jgi:hypothetical protein
MSYITDVADLFLSRCQNIKFLSPIDYATIAEWEKQEIPLAIVFDNPLQSVDLANIKSIKDFQSEVRKNFANWLHAYNDIE